MKKAYEPIDLDETFNKEFIKRIVGWIREDTFEWDCPFGKNEEKTDFFICMGWQHFKHMNKIFCSTPYQTRFIQQQLYAFWMNYRSEKRPKTSIYYITTERIGQFASSIGGIRAVGFLQSVWYFMDYLYIHGRIEKQACDDLKAVCTKLYTNKFASTYECYPASLLITEFPKMKRVES
jgi:hypothetical protein